MAEDPWSPAGNTENGDGIIASGVDWSRASIQIAYLNGDGFAGWSIVERNNASGAEPRDTVHFADINGDGMDDWVILNPKIGELLAYLNGGSANNDFAWSYSPAGSIASGLGLGRDELDGHGYGDNIRLDDNSDAVIYWDYRNNRPGNPAYLPFPNSDPRTSASTT